MAVQPGGAAERGGGGGLRLHAQTSEAEAPGADTGVAAEAVARFIAGRLPLRPAPGVAEVRLHLAAPGSGLGRLAAADPAFGTPYWAYAWAGGLALARHVLDRPEGVRGRRVLDLGTGSGLVAIAAALSGAAAVTAVDTDPYARAAAAVNAHANGVAVTVAAEADADAAGGGPEVVLAGDVFYDAAVAAQVLPMLLRLAQGGAEVLVGDCGRAHLPQELLAPLAAYEVADFSDGAATRTRSEVFRLRAPG